MDISGGCLCKAVQFSVRDEFSAFHLCHCKQCQKISGAANVANLFIKRDALRWKSGENNISVYTVPGRKISHGFCKTCGCPAPYLDDDATWVVQAGSLDRSPSLAAQDHIFWAERGHWYEAALTAPKCAQGPTDETDVPR
ncbi:GFA family protein [Gilvimarinus agarilyticus]|uniref:GFA family protein n=1 Tax=Gilvimarinus agarilyticus TaxID=679259 RepID=UPI0005A09867|nr:GFA family protein [Gilvimarinus agarilyticus]